MAPQPAAIPIGTSHLWAQQKDFTPMTHPTSMWQRFQRSAAASSFALLMFASPVSSQTAATLLAGTLTCQGKGSIGLIVGSKQTYACSYKPAGKAPAQRYSGVISKIGLDVGIKGANVLVWSVLASTNTLPEAALAGSYAGASADASLGLGAGANVLVGGSKKSVTLQPLSVQGQTGINLAVGVAGLKLKHQP